MTAEQWARRLSAVELRDGGAEWRDVADALGVSAKRARQLYVSGKVRKGPAFKRTVRDSLAERNFRFGEIRRGG